MNDVNLKESFAIKAKENQSLGLQNENIVEAFISPAQSGVIFKVEGAGSSRGYVEYVSITKVKALVKFAVKKSELTQVISSGEANKKISDLSKENQLLKQKVEIFESAAKQKTDEGDDQDSNPEQANNKTE